MQVGWNRVRLRRVRRDSLFVALAAALAGVNIWLWVRILADGANTPATLELALTAVASAATLFAVVYLWRNPLSRTVQMMATPALRQALATHHAGHIVAGHLQDPSRIRRADLMQPCNHHAAEVPAVTQTALRNEIGVALAGIAAEEVFAGESGSHAANDLAYATDIGVDMVGLYGMAGSPVSMGSARQRRSRTVARVLEDARARKELESLMREIKRDMVRTLLENRHVIIAVRDNLMRSTRLSGSELHDIIENAELVRSRGDDEVLVDLRIVSNRPAVGEM